MTKSKIPEEVAAPLREALTTGDKDAAVAATQKALDHGSSPLAIIQDVVVPALTLVGKRFENLEIFLPELMAAGEAGNACSALIEEAITKSGSQMHTEGVVVIGTVKGDIHDIGKNIVASLLKAQNFKVIDLGKDVPAATFIDAAESNKADVIAASALMSITRAGCREVAELLKELKLDKKYFYIVGGGSITQEYADEIGANGFSESAGGAVEVAKKLVATKRGA
ncbi:MAG: cobalamin-dependent protein [Anaerolineales bacterium]|jgi:corrinoid protein of di/trimethylamine methyltransferase